MLPAHLRRSGKNVSAAPAATRLVRDDLVGNRDRGQRRPRMPVLPTGLAGPRLRSDFGAGLANPSELGGFEELREV